MREGGGKKGVYWSVREFIKWKREINGRGGGKEKITDSLKQGE